MKRILVGLSYLVAFSIGGLVAYRLAMVDRMEEASANIAESRESAALVYSNLLLALVETNAAPDQYREGLLRHVAFLDQLKTKNGPVINVRTIAMSKMLIYLKLADVAQKSGNATEASSDLSIAVGLCGLSGFNDCSPTTVKRLQGQIVEALSRHKL